MHGVLPATPSSGAPLVVRPAQEADLDRVLEIHLVAFPDPRSVEVRKRVFLHNRLGRLEHLRVVERDGEVLGHAFSFPIRAWFGGKGVPGAAIASVGVAPEARGQGIAARLLEAVHVEARQRGDAFALLYPFRQGFYARMAYAPVARHRVLQVSPGAVPAGWRDAAPGVLRRAARGDREEIARVYQEAARRGTGFLERPDEAWEQDLLDERRQWVVLDHAGRLHGYVSFRLHQSEPHARVRAQVYELVATDDAARRRLFAALGSLGDQVGDVTVAVADDDPIDWAFVDGDRDRAGTEEVEHPLGVVSAGPMIRLLGAERALVGRGYAVDGALNVAVEGEPPFAISVQGGVATATPVTAGATLRMNGVALAAVAFGGLPLKDAARLGWLGSMDGEALSHASRMLELPRFFSLDPF